MASVSAKVFNTSELAEAVFLELPMRDLLVSIQRTCKQWKAVLDSSTKLQQAMLFKPLPGSPVAFHGSSFRPSNQAIFVHPLITLYPSGEPHVCFGRALAHPNASWRRQLVTQPPSIRLGLGDVSECYEKSKHKKICEAERRKTKSYSRWRVKHDGHATYMADLIGSMSGFGGRRGFYGMFSLKELDWKEGSTYYECIVKAKEGIGEGPWREVNP